MDDQEVVPARCSVPGRDVPRDLGQKREKGRGMTTEFLVAQIHKIEAESVEDAKRFFSEAEDATESVIHTVAAVDVTALFNKLTSEHANIVAAANPPTPEDAPAEEAAPA